jgi:IS30 family transposase
VPQIDVDRSEVEKLTQHCRKLTIETQLTLGMRPAAIAAGLMRARSTVTREIGRNGWKPERVQRFPKGGGLKPGDGC